MKSRTSFLRVASIMIRRWRGTLERGQSTVELALILPSLALIVFGTVDLGRLFFTYESLKNAAHEGALYGAHNPNDSSGIRTQTKTQDSALNFTGPPAIPINIKCYTSGGTLEADCSTASNKTRDTIEVAIVNYPFKPITPIISNVVGSTLQLNVAVRAGVVS